MAMKDKVLTIQRGVVIECRDPRVANVVIPDGVTEIEENAFHGRWGLKSVVIPEGLTRISWGAFEYCEALESVVLPSTLKEIWAGAFNMCKMLSSVEFRGTMAQFDAVTGKEDLLRDIPAKAVKCSDGDWWNPVIVEKGIVVKCLDKDLTSAVIPEGTTKISDKAFESCISLESIQLPDSITEIGKSAFGDCYSLKSIRIPKNVRNIDWYAFKRCSSLSTVEFGGTMAEWDDVKGKLYLFGYVAIDTVKCADGEWQLPLVLMEDGTAERVFDSNAKNVVIPEGTTKINSHIFERVKCLESLVFPEGLESIPHITFISDERRKSLKSVVLPSTLTTIEEKAFKDCTSLSTIEFRGTMAQWKAVEKGERWNEGVPATLVKCSDGESAIS